MAHGKQARDPDATQAALLAAAQVQFNAHGFFGTDTNRIARKAGYAPQTFYRHYADKTAIFVAVYESWWKSESDTLTKLLQAKPRADLAKVADAMIAFHVKWRGFRRSLRHLATEDARVRKVRSVARRAQIAAARPFAKGRSDCEIAAALLVLERLCDAVAEGEFADMGLSRASGRAAVFAAVKDAIG
jgi:AcrR family transcriptional regulator